MYTSIQKNPLLNAICYSGVNFQLRKFLLVSSFWPNSGQRCANSKSGPWLVCFGPELSFWVSRSAHMTNRWQAGRLKAELTLTFLHHAFWLWLNVLALKRTLLFLSVCMCFYEFMFPCHCLSVFLSWFWPHALCAPPAFGFGMPGFCYRNKGCISLPLRACVCRSEWERRDYGASAEEAAVLYGCVCVCVHSSAYICRLRVGVTKAAH